MSISICAIQLKNLHNLMHSFVSRRCVLLLPQLLIMIIHSIMYLCVHECYCECAEFVKRFDGINEVVLRLLQLRNAAKPIVNPKCVSQPLKGKSQLVISDQWECAYDRIYLRVCGVFGALTYIIKSYILPAYIRV